MSLSEKLKKSNRESVQLKAYALKLQGVTPKNIQFKDKDFLNKYYRDQDSLLELSDFNSNRTPTLDELTEEEQMNKLGDRKKKPSKRKVKRCKCK